MALSPFPAQICKKGRVPAAWLMLKPSSNRTARSVPSTTQPHLCGAARGAEALPNWRRAKGHGQACDCPRGWSGYRRECLQWGGLMRKCANNPMHKDFRCTSVLDAERGRGARPSANHQRCRTGVCRMHGGKLPGAPKGNRNARKHGHYSAETIALRRVIRRLLSGAAELVRPVVDFQTRQRRIDLAIILR